MSLPDEAATLGTVRDVVRDALEDTGKLGKMRAQMFREVFECINDPDQLKPSLPHEAVIINQLIREYLEWQQWHHTAAVLAAEAGEQQPVPASDADRHRLHKVGRPRWGMAEAGSGDGP